MKKIFHASAFIILILGFFYFYVNNVSFDQSKIKNLKVSDETNQIIFVLANKFGKAKLFFCEKNNEGEWNEKINSYAFVGKEGIGQASEGSMKTPKGAYNFTHAFGISENPGIKSFGYIKVDEDYYWVDDVNSAYYNKFVCTKDKNIVKDWNSAEHIIDYPEAYKYVLAFDYNKDCVPGKGSAFFLHVMTKNKYTAGCVSVPEKIMMYIMQNIKTDCKIVICNQNEILSY